MNCLMMSSVVSTQYNSVTDGQTPHHSIYRALGICVARYEMIIIIIIILFVHKKMYMKHINKTSEQNNKALRSALTAALR